MATNEDTGPASGTQLLQRAVALLRLITAHNRHGIRSVDLSRRARLHRATAHRILQGLAEGHMVRQDSVSKRYYLGSLVYEMGLAAAPRVALRDISRPYLHAIADRTGDTVFMTVRSGFDGVCVARADGSFPIKAFVLDVGRHRPLNIGAGGIAILSSMDDEEIDRIYRVNIERTQHLNPAYTEVALRRSIAACRRTGYVLNKVMESPPVSSVGMAIRYPNGKAAGAIGVSTVSSRLEKDRLGTVIDCMRDAIAAIEGELSHFPGSAWTQPQDETTPASPIECPPEATDELGLRNSPTSTVLRS